MRQGRAIEFEWRGREPFAATWRHQLEVHARRCAGEIPDTVVMVEHDPVVTLGRRGADSNLVASPEQLSARGIDYYRIERGGDITFHGPGQLVGYPIINLRERNLSVRDYVFALENLLIDCLSAFDIGAQRIPGLTGVWVGDTKLAAIGVAVRHGVSYHGFALNVSTELDYYSLIVPCGITGKEVGSMSSVLGSPVDLMDVKIMCQSQLIKHLG